MDLNELYQDLTNKKYTDVELILVDNNKQISINVHKIILVCSCNYFKKMFGFAEKNQSQITIHVDNSDIAHNIILSFYKHLHPRKQNESTDWKYLLETFGCRNFFCLPNDKSLLYDLAVREEERFVPILNLPFGDKVPSEGFELLLEVMEEFDYANDVKLIETIRKNIPNDYDLDNFSLEFIKEMLIDKNYLIVSGSSDCSIKIWDALTGNLLNTLKDHTDWVRCVAFSPDNSKIVSVSDDCSIKIWDAKTGNLLNTLRGHTHYVHSVAFSYDNLKIVSGSFDYSIKIWDANTGNLLHTINGHTNRVYCVAFSTDNLKIVSGSYDNSIKIWGVESGNLLKTLNGHTEEVTSVAFSHDNLKIVSCSNDCCIKIWDAKTGNLLGTLNGHAGWVNSVSFSSDNLKIVSCSDDCCIKIWDADTGNLMKTLEGHTDSVWSVAFSSDNRRIVSGSVDYSIKIWDSDTGNLLKTLNGHDKYVISVAISNPIYDDIDKKLIQYLNKCTNPQ